MATLHFVLVLTCWSLPGSLAFNMTTENHWSGGFEGKVLFNVSQNLDGWTMHFVFDQPVETFFSWEGMSENISDYEFILYSLDNNAVVAKGDAIEVNFVGHANESETPDVCIFIEELGNDDCTDSVINVTSLPVSGSKDYADALKKSILFYDAQRSGILPANNPIPWRGNSALNDCVVGGWYDGSDYVKFSFPMASAATLLLWGLNKFKDAYNQTGQLDLMYDMIQWPLDYLLHSWDPFTQQLVVQIGDPGLESQHWGRPEDMHEQRPCVRIGPESPGSDVAAQTSAALAIGSLVFQDKGDSDYARRLLDSAEGIYRFAIGYPGIYTDTVSTATNYYRSTGYKDEMCVAGAWLYKATALLQYLEDAKSNVQNTWTWAVDWNDKKMLCQLLLFEITGNSTYQQEIEAFLNGWLPGGHVPYTPCRLARPTDDGPLRYVANAAFTALLAADVGIEVSTYAAWAVEQINYILGDNPVNGGCFSFQIGHGQSYPLFPHHQASSCPDVPSPCTNAALHSLNPNPQLLVGAVVGGPGRNDTYSDDRLDEVHNGVTIEYNAGFQSALAGIIHLQLQGNLPDVNNSCPCEI